MLKKLSTALIGLVISLMILPMPITQAQMPFKDLENYSDTSILGPILIMVEEGSIKGYPDGLFHPEWSISEGEFLKILLTPILNTQFENMLTTEEEQAIADGDIARIIEIAVEQELLDLDLDNFDYDKPLTRIMAVQYIIDAYDLYYKNESVTDNYFKDIEDYDDKIIKQVLFLEESGVIQGRDDTHFVPEDTLLRGEAAKILYLSQTEFIKKYGELLSGIYISPYNVRIESISKQSLSAGDISTIIFTVEDLATDDIATGFDVGDFSVNVVGAADIVDFQEVNADSGVFAVTIQVRNYATAGPLKVIITLISAAGFSQASTDDYLQEQSDTNDDDISLVRVVPDHLYYNGIATIIATPVDHHNNPVSGLTLEAFISKGSGEIITQMTENPAGSGIYIGQYQAPTWSGDMEIGVRITDVGRNPTGYASITVGR